MIKLSNTFGKYSVLDKLSDFSVWAKQAEQNKMNKKKSPLTYREMVIDKGICCKTKTETNTHLQKV